MDERVKQQNIIQFSAIAAMMFVFGCIDYELQNIPISAPKTVTANLNVHVNIAAVNPSNGTLSKSSMVSLKSLILVLTSNALDTIRDTLAPKPNLDSQMVAKNYALNPLRMWKVLAMTKDLNDSILHEDSIVVPALDTLDTVDVSLNLVSRFIMSEAKFLIIPDSVGSPKTVLHINRLVWKVDGVVRIDSSVSVGTFFTPNASVTLHYDYVTPNIHTIQLLAYGSFTGWNPLLPLFSGSLTANSGFGDFELSWVGPSILKASLSVVTDRRGTTGLILP